MKTIRNRTITGETVMLDDTEFFSCRLVDCRLRYSGTAAIAFHDTIIENPVFDFFDAAWRAADLLHTFGLLVPNIPWGDNPPKGNYDA